MTSISLNKGSLQHKSARKLNSKTFKMRKQGCIYKNIIPEKIKKHKKSKLF